MITLKGLSWAHRRATHPLYAATAAFTIEHPGIDIHWDDRPLSGFEHESLADVASRYDLISFDHPFSGTISKEQIFVALDEKLPHLIRRTHDALFAGPSLSSYDWEGQIIGAPIDAAVMHAIYRADLLDSLGEPVPVSWMDTLALARRVKSKGKFVAAPGISPHGFLTFAGLCANLGKPLADDPKNTPALDREAAITALEAMRELQSLMPPNMEKCNSIQMHELMVQGDEIVYCPSVFGFATYGETDQRRRLAFSGFAGLKKPFHAGSIIGGVGLAVSNVSTKTEEALSFIEFALDTRTQNKHFASNHGQPALITSWENPTIDKRFNGFFSSVRETIEAAEIRPRFPGYIRCQAEAGEIVEVYLRDGTPAALTVDAISRILESGAQRRSM